jgi:hypothetical protein
MQVKFDEHGDGYMYDSLLSKSLVLILLPCMTQYVNQNPSIHVLKGVWTLASCRVLLQD